MSWEYQPTILLPPEEPRVEVTLRVGQGTGTGQTVCRVFPCELGRDAGCAVLVQDRWASRRHARLDWDGGLTVTDLGSTNGTRVNGARISGPCPLRTGDVLTLGRTQVTVERIEAGHGAPPRQGTVPLL